MALDAELTVSQPPKHDGRTGPRRHRDPAVSSSIVAIRTTEPLKLSRGALGSWFENPSGGPERHFRGGASHRWKLASKSSTWL
jgi:hypothetical protein